MARSDLLLNVVRAGATGDKSLFLRTVEALAADERAKNHNVLADRLLAFTKLNGSAEPRGTIRGDEPAEKYLHQSIPDRTIGDLVLEDATRRTCTQLVEEHHRMELLRSYNLEPRHRILLIGPPGNGKTSLAEALASEIALPVYTLRYDTLIGSYLGETNARIAKVFDFIRTRRCVLFFDEVDAIAKERGDPHDTGEVKRVVSSLLLQIDDLPAHVIVVAATNHSELMDRAVWRRFQVRLTLPAPTPILRRKMIELVLARLELPAAVPLEKLVGELRGLSFSEIEEFFLDIARKYVLSLPEPRLAGIVADCLNELRRRAPAPTQALA